MTPNPRPVRFTLLAIVILGATVPRASLGQVPAGFADVWRSVADRFISRVTDEGVVGASLAFVRGSDILAFERTGMADLADSRPVDDGTIYHWASITKTLTAIAFMQLRDRGLVSLDDPIVRYLPELREVHNPFGSADAITMRHLLSHSAGFRMSTWPWGGGEEWHPHEPKTWEQLVAMMPYTEVLFEPGTRYSYSNPGIVFVGRVIEIVSGEPFEAYMEKNVLRPLGMTTAYFDHTPWHLADRRSHNWYRSPGGLVDNGPDFDTGITVSNGGLNASVPDMANYLAFLTGSVSGAADVLDRASLEAMWHEQVPIGTEDGLETAMGLSFFLLHDGSRTFVGHTGGQKGFVSFIYVHPPSQTAAIAAFNTLGMQGRNGSPPRPDTRDIMADIRARLFAEVFPLFGPGDE